MAGTSFSLICTYLVTVILSSYLSNCQPDIYFSVMEEEVDTVIGNISQSNYIANTFAETDIASLMYEIRAKNNPGRDISLFEVGRNTGVLKTAQAIDREAHDFCYNNDYCSLELTVRISVDGIVDTPTIEIEILDINDNPPEFDQESLSLQITENSPSGTSRDIPDATDKDSPRYNVNLDGYQLQSDVQGIFGIVRDEEGLRLVLKGEIDREQTDSYDLQVVAYDKGQPAKSGLLDIHIKINDANDVVPKFTELVYEKEIREDLPVNSTIITVKAIDGDLGLNAQVAYGFGPVTGTLYKNTFGINTDNGTIYLKGSLDYETQSVYELTVEATDKGDNRNTTTVLITVQDVNDEIPRVQVDTLTKRKNAEVQENLPANTLVALIIVSDADVGDNGRVTCSMDHQLFQLKALGEEKQFKIVTKQQLDRESQSSYSLQITCKDEGSPSLEGSGVVNVTVLDDNDHDPEFEKTEYHVTVPENGGIGAFIIQVSATDEDLGENGTVTYSISNPDDERYVEIDSERGILKTAKRLDYETRNKFTVIVKATDHGKKPRSSVVAVQITVSDENDHPPTFDRDSYVFNIKENSQSKSFVGRVEAHDYDSASNNAFVYSIGQFGDASSFNIDPVSGNITTKRVLDREFKDRYSFLVYATDHQDGFLSTSATVTVHIEDENDNAPKIIYPVGNNNTTVKISNEVPLGYRIMQVSAQDDDLGKNSNLSYSLKIETSDGRTTPRFVINEYIGDITTNKDLTSDDYLVSVLTLTVTDGGTEARSSTTTVTIIIDSSISFGGTPPEPSDSTSSKNSTNTVIIVCVTIVTVIIAIGLITAIFCLRRRNQLKSPPDGGMKSVVKAPNTGKSSKAPHIIAVPKSNENVEKNESFSISNASGNIPIVSGQPNTEATPNISVPAHSPGGMNSLDTTGSDDTLPSNADSGRGPSEGGAEIGVMRLDSDRQRPINRRLPPPLDLASAKPEAFHKNHLHLDPHRPPQSAGPFPRHLPQPYHQHPEFQYSPSRHIPQQESVSRSYPNSPNLPESEYVTPDFRHSAVEFNQWHPGPQQQPQLQQLQQQHEMTNMQYSPHHQYHPQHHHQQHQAFFGSNSIPMGGIGMDNGYHSQNTPLSQSAPVETVFHGHPNGHFNNSMTADSGYSSQNGGSHGFGQQNPQVWDDKSSQGFSPPHLYNLPRQYSEPVHSQHNTYYRMDGVPINHNQSCVDV